MLKKCEHFTHSHVFCALPFDFRMFSVCASPCCTVMVPCQFYPSHPPPSPWCFSNLGFMTTWMQSLTYLIGLYTPTSPGFQSISLLRFQLPVQVPSGQMKQQAWGGVIPRVSILQVWEKSLGYLFCKTAAGWEQTAFPLPSLPNSENKGRCSCEI